MRIGNKIVGGQIWINPNLDKPNEGVVNIRIFKTLNKIFYVPKDLN